MNKTPLNFETAMNVLPKKRARRIRERVIDEAQRVIAFIELDATRVAHEISMKSLTTAAGFDYSNYLNYTKGVYIPTWDTLKVLQQALYQTIRNQKKAGTGNLQEAADATRFSHSNPPVAETNPAAGGFF